jgi:pectate lyase
MPADNFDRADSGSLGADWTNVTGTCQILSNAARPATQFARCIARRSESAFPADQYAQAKIEVISGAESCQGGLVVRAQDSSNYYYCVIGTTSIELRKFVSGGDTFLNDWANAFTAATFYTAKIEAIGTTVKVYVDTGGGLTERISVTDSSLSTGYPGIFFSPNASSGFGDCDDFECTDAITGSRILKPNNLRPAIFAPGIAR